jgi:hypothetical protein
MAIEELKGIFRAVTIRREKDADSSRRGNKRPPPPKKEEETPDPEKGKVDIKV